MRPRGYFATFVMLAMTTGLPFGVIWSWVFASWMRSSFGEVFVREGLPCAAMFGLVVGAILAFKLRAIVVTVPVGAERTAFLSRVTMRLAELNYHPESTVGDVYTFRPSFYAGRAAGRITVVLESMCTEATILGPLMHVRKLRTLLVTAGA